MTLIILNGSDRKMMMRLPFFAASLLLLADTPAAAEPGKTGQAQFRMAAIDFSVSVPSGYCLPQGKNSDIAQMIAAADSQNITHLTIPLCNNDEWMDYYILKTPKKVITTVVDLPEFLSAMGKAFDNPAIKKFIANEQIDQQVEKDLAQIFGGKIDFSGEIKPLGKDERCAYLGGVGEFKNVPQPYKIAIGACMTVVSKKVITVYSYGPRIDNDGVLNEIKKARALAGKISATSNP